MLKSIFVLAAAVAIAGPVLAQPAQPGTPGQPGMGSAGNRDATLRRDGTRRGERDYRNMLMDSRGMITPYPLNEQILPRWFYREGYRLTPREYNRWRKAGFSQREVYMIANAASDTGLDPSIFANAMYNGAYARRLSLDFGIPQRRLIRILPEWRTAAWAQATRDEAIRGDVLNVWW